MKIDRFKHAFKYCDLVINGLTLKPIYKDNYIDNNGRKFTKKSLSKCRDSRVYIITSDKEIIKIGSSASVGGVDSTIQFYCDGGLGGSSSPRTIGCFLYLYKECLNNKTVEIYIMLHEPIITIVPSINGNVELPINVQSTEWESIVKNEYKSVCGKYPILNKQENHDVWDDVIMNIASTQRLCKGYERKQKINELMKKYFGDECEKYNYNEFSLF